MSGAINYNVRTLLLYPKSESRWWISVPLGYVIFLQILTGIPKPDGLREFNANQVWVALSEELFSYPFWLQDLSHLPLFFLLAWSWCWYLGPASCGKSLFFCSASYFSFAYACLSELSQFYVPMRFPSIGDLTMNLIGVLLGLIVYRRLCSTVDSHKLIQRS